MTEPGPAVLEPSAMPGRMTLSDYVEKHHRMLSVIGVFTALLIFTNQITGSLFRGFLSFTVFTCLVALWSDLQSQFPTDAIEKSVPLRLFGWGTSVMMLFVIGYWALLFEESLGSGVVVFPLTIGLYFVSTRLMQRKPTLRPLVEQHPGSWTLFRLVLWRASPWRRGLRRGRTRLFIDSWLRCEIRLGPMP